MIKSVLVIGAGAIGSYFIKCLNQQNNVDLYVLAKDERKTRLEANGVVINGEKYSPKIIAPNEIGHVDLVIVCVKYYSLPEIIDDMRMFVDDRTIILSTLNGVDSEELIIDGVGTGHVLYGYMMISSARVGNSIEIKDADIKGVYFGDVASNGITPKANEVDEFFKATQVKAFLEKDIIAGKWKKWAFNISYNLPQAALGVPLGSYMDSEHMDFLRKGLDEEVHKVAAAYGISIGEICNDSVERNKMGRYSTLQDLDAARKTEIDMLAGVLIKKAIAKGMSVPYAEMIYHEIKVLEEKNSGKFEYN